MSWEEYGREIMCVGYYRHAVEDEGAEVVEGSRLTFNGLHDAISHKI
jgi:hypothetical protein